MIGTIIAIAGNEDVFASIKDGASWFTILNLAYVMLVFFVITFTNMRAEGAPAINLFLTITLTLVIAYFLGGKALMTYIPAFLIFMNSSFYFTFSVGILLLWLFSVFVYDRRKSWLVRPGRFTEERLFPKRSEAYDTSGLRLVVHSDDIVCHNILGLRLVGDITVASKDHGTVIIVNVFDAQHKVEQALQLVQTHFTVDG
jgi:hypothetical protein